MLERWQHFVECKLAVEYCVNLDTWIQVLNQLLQNEEVVTWVVNAEYLRRTWCLEWLNLHFVCESELRLVDVWSVKFILGI